MKKIILVVCPFTSSPSAGVDNLVYLVKILRREGFNSYLVNIPYRTTVRRYREMKRDCLWLTEITNNFSTDNKFLIIYPEIITKNFLRADSFILYLLQQEKLNPLQSQASQIWYHGKNINTSIYETRELSLNIIDIGDVYLNFSKQRKQNKICFYENKVKFARKPKIKDLEVCNLAGLSNLNPNYSELFYELSTSKSLIVAEPTRLISEAIALRNSVVFIKSSRVKDSLTSDVFRSVKSVESLEEAESLIAKNLEYQLDESEKLLTFYEHEKHVFEERLLDYLSEVEFGRIAQFKLAVYQRGLKGCFLRLVNAICVTLIQKVRKLRVVIT